MPFMSNNRDAAETMEKYSKLELAFSKLKEELAKTRDKSTEYYTEL